MYRPPITDDELNALRQARLSIWLMGECSRGDVRMSYLLAHRELDRAVKYETARRRTILCTIIVWLRTWCLDHHHQPPTS